jgi:hypothetical protein
MTRMLHLKHNATVRIHPCRCPSGLTRIIPERSPLATFFKG